MKMQNTPPANTDKFSFIILKFERKISFLFLTNEKNKIDFPTTIGKVPEKTLKNSTRKNKKQHLILAKHVNT